MAAVASSRARAHGQQTRRDLIVIGASAGGVEALQQLVRELPEDLHAGVVIVLHVPAGGRSLLAAILARAGPLPAMSALDGATIELGHIYVAPPDYHLLIDRDTLRLVRGPRENGHRPAIDLLFRSAAQSRGPRAIGIVLSGLLDDGAAGLREIKDHGGAALVQEPDDAVYPAMPRNAIAATDVDAVVPVAQMAAKIAGLLEDELETVSAKAAVASSSQRGGVDVGPGVAGPGDVLGDRKPDREGQPDLEPDPESAPAIVASLGAEPTGLTCPDCGGALWEWRDGALQRFGCYVGHTFSVQSMLDQQGRALESGLWSALRGLEERADLMRRLARSSSGLTRRNFEFRARRATSHADQLRDTLTAHGSEPVDDLDIAPTKP